MENRDFKRLLKRYIKNKASKEEIKSYESFYDSFQRQESTWEDPELSNIKSDIFNKVRQSTGINDQLKANRFVPFLKIAVSILILLSVGFVVRSYVNNNKVNRQYISIATKPGEKKTVVLEDGSVITLNVDSKMSYEEPFTESSRNVILEGEAFFDVAKDSTRPFIINSGAITTTVLGTSFNIYAYEQENINVTVSTGKVKVTYNPEDKLNETYDVLKPGEKVLFDIENKTLTKYKVHPNKSSDWQKNIIRFEEEPFNDILKRLSRIFNVDIECANPGLLDKIVTSYFDNPDFIDVITDLQFMLGFEYEFVEDGTAIIIK